MDAFLAICSGLGLDQEFLSEGEVEDTARRLSYLADDLEPAAPTPEADDMFAGSPVSLSDVWRFFQKQESTEPISPVSPYVPTAATFDWTGLHGDHMMTSPVRQTPGCARTSREEGPPPCKRPCYEAVEPAERFSFTDTPSPGPASSPSSPEVFFSFTDCLLTPPPSVQKSAESSPTSSPPASYRQTPSPDVALDLRYTCDDSAVSSGRTPGGWSECSCPCARRLEAWQEAELTAVFAHQAYVSATYKERLATRLGLSTDHVRRWFRNTRRRHLRMERRLSGSDVTSL